MKFLKFSVTCFLIVVSYSHQIPVLAETITNKCVILTTPLSFGRKDTLKIKEVALLQQYLKDNGFLLDSPTGYFGKGTRKAVMTFQNTYSIEPTGIVGPMTRAKIRELSCGVSKSTQITPASAIVSTSTVTPQPQAQIPVQVTSPVVVVTSAEPSSAPYQVFVNGQRQIDASSVPKSYADQSCATVAQSNTQNTVVCKWNNKEFFSYIPTVAPVAPAQPQAQEPVVQVPATLSGPPSVVLNIGPTNVPKGGGYDYFELKTVGMSTCTLYFKEEPSASWSSGGSSLGVNFALPGFKGMTQSRSYYVSCKDGAGQKMDSNSITIHVGS